MRVNFPRWEDGDPGWLLRTDIGGPRRLLWWISLPSTLKEMPYSGIIGLSTLKKSGQVKTVVISFTRLQDERLNQDVRRTRPTPQPTAYKTPAPSTPSRPPQPKKFTREELRDRSVKGFCWHYDEPWSHDHRCKKGRLLLIEPIDESELEEEDLDHEEENMGEDLELVDVWFMLLPAT
ncbi:hypothetical protein BHM03_00041671 [Ensete ventricosum]|nr:hypothetical protein BHM03_00041671 [Ensete ventricosum]